MVHIPGVKQKAADAVSRHPNGPNSPEKLHLPDDVAIIGELNNAPTLDLYQQPLLTGIRHHDYSSAAYSSTLNDRLTSSTSSILNSVAITWDTVKLATTSDPIMSKLVSTIETGFPDSCHNLPTELHKYFQFREHLYTVDGVALYKDRIVIPPSLRENVLTTLHSAHQGVTAMIVRWKRPSSGQASPPP